MGKSGDGCVVLLAGWKPVAAAMVALAATIAVSIRSRGLLRLIPILCGVAAGYAASLFLGLVDLSPVSRAPWLAVPRFVFPRWSWEAVFFILPVAIAPMIEHFGDILAIGSVTGRDYLKDPGIQNTLLGDGLASSLAALLGGPPNTTYSEVTGAVTLIRVFNPAIMTWAAGLAIVLAFFGKFNALLATVPVPVMGGIMMLMFGSVAAVGLNTLIKARVDLEEPRNLVIVSSVLVMGIGGLALNFDGLTLQGVSLCGVVAVVLNLILPRVRAGA